MKPIIVANWKMNPLTLVEAKKLFLGVKKGISKKAEVVVCPPFIFLSALSGLKLGGQNCFWEEKGAFTGEISASLLKDAGAQYVIIGHSERRQFFHETDETVNKKTKAALKSHLTPIVCVGETLSERESKKTFKVIETQLKGGFANFGPEEMKRLVIAYEPVWAIGTGKVATPEEAQEVHAFIRKELSKIFGNDVTQHLRILYGGSVKPDNISNLMGEGDIDGALVGGASLDANQFSEIVRGANSKIIVRR